ncbi:MULTISPECIES: GNAT family N-acetyltransferase [Spirulina sp. CCY15215]|uniref:GNAT family N-acetyltransferase n=1 Tax=Spirulina sp. CCY15215 TaxID=2767591 RepID=UPI0019504FF0|nr:GNAT family N-acetyltransferase [Spirulina major]
MTRDTEITFQKINHRSPYLETVINLGDANSDTLGFLAKGAFINNAAKGNIVVVINTQGECIGYILYNYNRSRDLFKLVHLCIDRNCRSRGIARQCIEYLKYMARNTRGIELTCRRDFRLDRMWSTFGFVPEIEKDAKTPGKINTVWRFDFQTPQLLSMLLDLHLESNLGVIIDFSILFELVSENIENSKESKALLADWLQDILKLGFVNEIFDCINIIDNEEERKKYRNFTANLTNFPFEETKYISEYQKLREFFCSQNVEINNNKIKYIAQTLASDVSFLVTRDLQILNLANTLYQQFKISIKSPTDLIIQLTEFQENQEYQPIRLAGLTDLRQEKLTNDKIDDFSNIFWFQEQDRHETKSQFQQKMRRFVIEKDKFESVIIKDSSGFLMLIVYDRSDEDELEIPMIRVGKGNEILIKTIMKHSIFQTISTAVKEDRKFTRITDLSISPIVLQLIQEDHFLQVGNSWIKANFKMADTANNLGSNIIYLITQTNRDYEIFQQFGEILKTASLDKKDTNILFMMEKFLHPMKIIDAEIPNFIIPIQPFWAENLFDKKLAEQTLNFFSKPEITINREAVYYKKNYVPPHRNCINGRILWYVTKNDKDRGYTNISAIRACSHLEEVVVGKPRELYKRFRNLGVFEEKNVLEIEKGNEDTEIMAIRFSNTELFDRCIFHDELQKLSQQVSNKNISVVGTSEIPKELFAIIYKLGLNIKETNF